MFLVPEAGIEPAWPQWPRDFKQNYHFRTISSDHVQILFEFRY